MTRIQRNYVKTPDTKAYTTRAYIQACDESHKHTSFYSHIYAKAYIHVYTKHRKAFNIPVLPSVPLQHHHSRIDNYHYSSRNIHYSLFIQLHYNCCHRFYKPWSIVGLQKYSNIEPSVYHTLLTSIPMLCWWIQIQLKILVIHLS